MENRAEKIRHNLKQDPNALEYQLETDKLADQLKKKLGLQPVRKTDKNGNQYVEWQESEYRVLNREGIEKIVGLVRAIVDKNNTTSIYSEQQIQSIMQHLHTSLARELAEEWETYGISKRGQADKVMEIVTDNAWSAFNSSLEGRKLEIIGSTAETKTQTVQKSESDSKKRFSL